MRPFEQPEQLPQHEQGLVDQMRREFLRRRDEVQRAAEAHAPVGFDQHYQDLGPSTVERINIGDVKMREEIEHIADVASLEQAKQDFDRYMREIDSDKKLVGVILYHELLRIQKRLLDSERRKRAA